MDHKYAIEELMRLEDQVDVTSLIYKDLHAWPHIRLQFWNQMLHPGKFTMPANLNVSELASQIKEAFFKTASYVPYLHHHQLHQQHLERLAGHGPIDVLLFSRVEDHADQFAGSFLNRHIDPMATLIGERLNWLKLELGTQRMAATSPRSKGTYFLDSVDYLRCDAQRSLVRAFQHADGLPEIEHAAALSKAIQADGFQLSFDAGWTMMELEKQRHYRDYFKEVLRVLQPQAVMLVCYYYDIYHFSSV